MLHSSYMLFHESVMLEADLCDIRRLSLSLNMHTNFQWDVEPAFASAPRFFMADRPFIILEARSLELFTASAEAEVFNHTSCNTVALYFYNKFRVCGNFRLRPTGCNFELVR